MNTIIQTNSHEKCFCKKIKYFFFSNIFLFTYCSYQVAPAELEDTLIGHDEIMDACVIGIPCDRSGELPRAYVVRKPDSNLTAADVKEFIKERLSDHKQLRGGVVFIDQLPKSASGKLLRRVLKDEYMKSL